MQTHEHEPSGMETTLTLIGTAVAIAALLVLGNLVPDLLLYIGR